MPIKVSLQTEIGASLADASDVHDVLVTLADAASEHELEIAHTIDPYGDTVLNRLQVPMLLRDFDLMGKYASEGQAAFLVEVRILAERVVGEPHLYLKFIGD